MTQTIMRPHWPGASISWSTSRVRNPSRGGTAALRRLPESIRICTSSMSSEMGEGGGVSALAVMVA